MKWIVGFMATGAALLVLSIFIADERLAPPFEAPTLDPIDVPVGEPLPVGVVLFASDRSGTYELYSQPIEGGEPVQLTDDPGVDSWRPRLSPDRRTVLFYRSPAGVGDTDLSQASLWMTTGQGTATIEVLPVLAHGWTRQGQAEWSPTGDELVMMGERPSGFQIWITTIDGRAARSLVSDPGNNTDPSWDPDGRRVLYVACPQSPCAPNEGEIFAVLSAGAERVQITADELADAEPRFSPDGSQIIMRSQIEPGDDDGLGQVWDIRVVPTNRSRPPRRIVGDQSVNGSAIWLDNGTVLFHRTEQDGGTADIYRAAVAGGNTGIVAVITNAANDLYPAA